MYRAPISEMRFILQRVLGVERLAGLLAFRDFSVDLLESVLTEAGRFADSELESSNAPAEREGARWTGEGVRMPAALKRTYQRYVEAGWLQLTVPQEQGGQGMPQVVGSAVEDLFFGANLSFMLLPQLARGALEALLAHASPELIARFAPRYVSGEWASTMNLTEPQAGTDLAAIRTRAVPQGEHYRLYGQKIFITYGDHDLTENIVHLVLARIEGAPAGVRGISMFLVPKILLGAGGAPGEPNDVHCVSIEHKLGLHASPTCVMSYGDKQGALGYLVGEPHQGLRCMFVMMNAARLGVAMQAVALSERAGQYALHWARNRVQGRPPEASGAAGAADGVAGAGAAATIVHYPDVKRMLLAVRSGVMAMRALALYAALQLDLAHGEADPLRRRAAQERAELLTPIVKGWCTEFAQELVAQAFQVHGGMGYIEETGVAQILRDVRITTIYEGTTAIQANDLLGRKMQRDNGAALYALLDECLAELDSAGGSAARGDAGASDMHQAAATAARQAADGVRKLRSSGAELLAQAARSSSAAQAVAVPFLRQCGLVLGGWLAARTARVCAEQAPGRQGDAAAELAGRMQAACFYLRHHLPVAGALAEIVAHGAASVTETPVELLS